MCRLLPISMGAILTVLVACSGTELGGLEDNGEESDDTSSSASQAQVTDSTGALQIGVKIDEGDEVANEMVAAKLGVSGGLQPASDSVNVSSDDVIASGKLALPIYEASSLLLQGRENLVIMYKVKDGSNSKYGLIPLSQVMLEEDVANFELQGDGNYQAAILNKFIF